MSPERQKRIPEKMVAAVGTDFPLKANHRTIAMGRTTTTYASGYLRWKMEWDE